MATESVKKLHIVTHGCQMNEYDSSRMADLLGESHNMVSTDNADEADVILLNTCSIREKAQEIHTEVAKEKGVKFHFSKKVNRIIIENKKAIGVETEEEKVLADIVISNMDIFSSYKK